MATPAKHQGSTPKSALAATPQNTHSSPFPAYSVPRGFAGKSPAIKTPSTAGHGHQHNLSTSSHPSSTPLAALMAGEDAMNFSSPATAAVMAQLGTRSLTPLGSHDGLGITGDGLGLKDPAIPTTRNLEEEWQSRLRKAIEDLQPRVVGRGVCREGVVNVAQLAGFQPLWQDNVLTIAGDNVVDLEIEFENEHPDVVKDVSLKIASSGSSEAELAVDASRVIKENLTQSVEERAKSPWKPLDAFARNLERLGALDRLSQEVNCLKALDGLYESFQKIWKETKKRKSELPDSRLLSLGPIGRPALHKTNSIGLGLDYWAEKSNLREARRAAHGRSKETLEKNEQHDSSNHDRFFLDDSPLWTARIECEAGFPSIQVSESWISDDILSSNGDSSSVAEIQALQPAWLDTPLLGPDQMAVDEESKVPKTPNVRFVLRLEPAVQIPGQVAAAMFEQAPTAWQQKPPKPYDSLIRESLKPDRSAGREAALNGRTGSNSWVKDVPMVDEAGKVRRARHEYRLRSEHGMYCYTVDEIPFGHPRQVLVHLPVFRQYARFWVLLQSVTSSQLEEQDSNSSTAKLSSTTLNSRVHGFHKGNQTNSASAKLDAVLKGRKNNNAENSENHASLPSRIFDINLSLLPVSAGPPIPCIDIFFSDSRNSSPTVITKSCRITVQVLPNGALHIPLVQNVASIQSEATQEKLRDILDFSEDLTVLMAWILQH
ncbi:MAG: hypothetical protein Q9227_003403 [Pyrenula ochraceoflavens]